MMLIKDYIQNLSLVELKEIFANFNELEKNGFIGDCYLRTLSENIGFDISKNHDNIVLWMNQVANACYRIVAERWLIDN